MSNVAASGVEHLDVFEGHGLHFLPRLELFAIHPLVLEAAEPAFRRRVIPTISTARHRAGHAVLRQLCLEHVAGILAATIRVMHQRGRRPPPEPCHSQRIGHDVRCPDLIRCKWCEIALQQVWRDRQVVLRVRRHLETALVLCLDAVLLHQPLHPLFARRISPCPQCSDHARAAIRTLVFRFLSCVSNILRHPWKTIFRGKVKKLTEDILRLKRKGFTFSFGRLSFVRGGY